MANCAGGAIDTGDTAAMIFATTFVMLQTPAIGFTQAGLIRRKNALSMLMQTFTGMCIGSLLFFVFGFSLTFSKSYGKVIGDLDWAFMVEVPWDDCLPLAATIPGILYAAFQMSFALMVPVIVTGAWIEKMNFKAFLVFVTLWPVIVYYPLAHWVWNPGGWLFDMGVLDFAGGITIHTCTGTAALIVALALQRRKGMKFRGERRKKIKKFKLRGPFAAIGYVFRKDPESRIGHHSLPLTLIGASLIWIGWYSFNGGSALGGNGTATKALMNTHISACTGGLTWVLLTWIQDGKFHMTELVNGAFAGLAGITPGSGFVEVPMSVPIGLITSFASYVCARGLKKFLDVDDVLDVTALQGAAGATGSILVGFLASCPSCKYDGVFYGGGEGMLIGVQVLGVTISILWTALWTAVIVLVMMWTPFVGINITPEEEEQGLDLCQIGEQAYDERLALVEDLGEEAATGRLCEAAAAGDLNEVKSLIAQGADPEGGDHDGRRPAHLAAAEGHLGILKFLKLKHNVDLTIKDNLGNTPLDDAVQNHRTRVVAWLKEQGVGMNSKKHLTDLLYACMSGNLDEVKKLSQGIDINSVDYDHRTPLMIAASDGHLLIVKYLVRHCKADLEATDRWGNTALKCSLLGNHLAVAQFLRDIAEGNRRQSEDGNAGKGIEKEREMIEIQANPKMQASVRELCAAAARGEIDEVKRLIKKGADPSLADYDGRTALHLAAASGHMKTVKYLLRKKKVNINALDRWRHTPLQEAINNRRQHVTEYLKRYGAVSVNNTLAVQLCALAAEGNLDELEQMAKDEDVDFNVGDYDSRTALHLAASEGHKRVVEWLVLKGVNVVAKDRYNNTARDDALRGGHKDIGVVLEGYEAEIAARLAEFAAEDSDEDTLRD